jgi:hypothetical protein
MSFLRSHRWHFPEITLFGDVHQIGANSHRKPQNRIRFLDNPLGICETLTWRCRVIRAIAKAGTVSETGTSSLFRERKGYRPLKPRAPILAPMHLWGGTETWL